MKFYFRRSLTLLLLVALVRCKADTGKNDVQMGLMLFAQILSSGIKFFL